MSKVMQFPPYEGQLDLDEYGEILCTLNTAQFIRDKLTIDNCFAGRIFVGAHTTYQMVFVNMHVARRNNQAFLTNPFSWYGSGDIYVGIERIGGFSFTKNTDIHPNYVAEKHNERCEEIAENLAFLISSIFSCNPSSYCKNKS